MNSVKIAIVAAEIAPYAKVGGLADVIAALPQAFKQAGADPVVILPGYKSLLEHLTIEVFAPDQALMLGRNQEQFNILRAQGAGGVPLYLIDHPVFFDREGIYGDQNGDYPDNFQRFIFFGRAAANLAAVLRPDVLHAHDWHAAAAPVTLRADPALRAQLPQTSTF